MIGRDYHVPHLYAWLDKDGDICCEEREAIGSATESDVESDVKSAVASEDKSYDCWSIKEERVYAGLSTSEKQHIYDDKEPFPFPDPPSPVYSRSPSQKRSSEPAQKTQTQSHPVVLRWP